MQIGVLASIEFVGTTIIHQLHLFIERQKLMERLMNYSLKSRCRWQKLMEAVTRPAMFQSDTQAQCYLCLVFSAVCAGLRLG